MSVEKFDSFNLSDPYFDQVRLGLKTVEGRIYRGKWRTINVGNEYTVKGSGDDFKVKITSVVRVRSFEELYGMYNSSLLPATPSSLREKPWQIYREWFSTQDEAEYGVIGIVMEKLPDCSDQDDIAQCLPTPEELSNALKVFKGSSFKAYDPDFMQVGSNFDNDDDDTDDDDEKDGNDEGDDDSE